MTKMIINIFLAWKEKRKLLINIKKIKIGILFLMRLIKYLAL